ncbi:hypothetical protein B0H19DRAFT_1186731 [Mycena capillaripes]|nr:hypothetical protein B0H19DRAFT_1186731 [Mycena capillaripes]
MDSQKLEILNDEIPGSQGILRPITSYSTNRYANKAFVDPYVMEISPGLFTTSQEPEPGYLAPLWSSYVHPEGQLYFYRDAPLRVVTEAYLFRTDTMEHVCRWIEHIEGMLSKIEIMISGDIELFLQLEGEDCAYYFVDHATYAQFWLESSDTDKLGLPPVSSTSQLKIVLEELYWVHVEHFPMHLPALPSQKLNEIISIFNHGLCDQMTSRVSTFLFTAQDCNVFEYLAGTNGPQILNPESGNMNDGHTTWIIARLWSVIDHNKYLTHCGQEQARLSRDQSILFDPEQKHRWISSIMTYLTFKTSDVHLARLDDVFVDHMVYEDRWAKLVGDCLKQWRACASGAFAGLLLHLPFLVLNAPSPGLLTASAALFTSAMGTSILLEHMYEPMEGLCATDAALQLWGYLILLGNCLLLASRHLGLRAAAGLSGLSLLVIFALYSITSGTFLVSWDKCMRFFHRGSESAAIQMV